MRASAATLLRVPSFRVVHEDSSHRLRSEREDTLDDPAARLQHYLQVLMCELRREPEAAAVCDTIAEHCGTDRR